MAKNWKQKVLLKNGVTGKQVDSFEFDCEEGSQANTDGIFEALDKFEKAGYSGIDQDEAFDSLVIDQEPFEFETELQPGELSKFRIELDPFGQV